MSETLYRFIVDIYADSDEPEATGWGIMEQLDSELDNIGDMLCGDASYIRTQSTPKGFKVLEASDA